MNFKVWIKGLGVAVLSAFITSLAAVNLSPSTFNFMSKAGFKNIAILAGIIAVKAVLLYLKTSPLQIAGQVVNPGVRNIGQGGMKAPVWVVAALLLLMPMISHAQAPGSKGGVKKHALAKVFRVSVKPFTATVGHPKRTLKQVAGSLLFATETGVDGVRLVLEGADKAFDAISIQGKVPVLDQIYGFVSIGAKDAAKLDAWLERQEQSLFGTHN